jgi:hypothetical protein
MTKVSQKFLVPLFTKSGDESNYKKQVKSGDGGVKGQSYESFSGNMIYLWLERVVVWLKNCWEVGGSVFTVYGVSVGGNVFFCVSEVLFSRRFV